MRRDTDGVLEESRDNQEAANCGKETVVGQKVNRSVLAKDCLDSISGGPRLRVASPRRGEGPQGGTYGLMGSLMLSKKSSILLVCFLMDSSALASSAGVGDPN